MRSGSNLRGYSNSVSWRVLSGLEWMPPKQEAPPGGSRDRDVLLRARHPASFRVQGVVGRMGAGRRRPAERPGAALRTVQTPQTRQRGIPPRILGVLRSPHPLRPMPGCDQWDPVESLATPAAVPRLPPGHATNTAAPSPAVARRIRAPDASSPRCVADRRRRPVRRAPYG